MTVALISLEEFFHGNSWWFSIAVNLGEDCHLGVDAFHRVLDGIRAKDTVQDVLVEVSDLTEPEQDWFYSDTVFILTSAAVSEVNEWVSDLSPSVVTEDWELPVGVSFSFDLSLLENGMRPVCVWWD